VAAHSIAFDNTWEIDANWKVFQDNTIECYHCSTTHPELSRALEMKPEKQEFWVGGQHWIHHRIPFRDGVNSGINYQRIEGQPFYYYYHWVFPSTYMQFSGRGFDLGTLDIVAVDKIRFRHICFLPHDTSDAVRAKGQAIIEADPTIWQDVELCNRVQKSHASGMAPQARVFAAPEFLLSHFHHLIVDMLTDAPAKQAGARAPRLRQVAGT
jgi:Rieske 2Fe-2S family protein